MKFHNPDNWFTRKWTKFWITKGSLSRSGRFAMQMASVFAAPHKSRVTLANFSKTGYIAGSVIIHHDELSLGKHVFIDEGSILFKRKGKGRMVIADHVVIYRQVFMESGMDGSIFIDEKTSIHPRCQINAFCESVKIGKNVMIAPNCAIYSYNHGLKPGELILHQPLESKGPVVIGDGVWIGFGSIITSGVTIGEGSAIGAGSVVTKDIPPDSVAAGNPAKVIKKR